ncbi:signal peptidase I [Saccharothrix coeruleofusca]|uniref:Signal peptidase I n=1 Tax=Saccharothrix coeruleofusca TaxID=33919 RepID=A0A918ANN9_9PSEU|nr:signal peptidase I [Saccharothrix coeruleofusca]GGP63700.1 hypothetical protein GCM10010185_40510 [Saccharothrix coeruleofusca]
MVRFVVRWVPVGVLLVVALVLLALSTRWAAFDELRYGKGVMGRTVPDDSVVVTAPLDRDQPRHGDVVLFRTEPWDGKRNGVFVMRVIGLGGDEVGCCAKDGSIYVNGHPIAEDYLRSDGPGGVHTPFAAQVPDDHVYLAGDWRNHSRDSRSGDLGPVPRSAVVARVVGVRTEDGVVPVPTTSAFADAGFPASPPVDLDSGAPLRWTSLSLAGAAVLWFAAGFALARRRDRSGEPAGERSTRDS